METKDHENVRNTAHNIDEVERFLQLLHTAGERFEIRGIGGGSTDPRIFSDPNDASEYIQGLDRDGIYVTLNPIAKEFSGGAVKDVDIDRRHWLLVDCDPERPKHSNSTDEELEAALFVRGQIEAYLSKLGHPVPIQVMSGNGGHLLYRIDLEPESDLVKRVLKSLHKRFSTDKVKVDTAVCNASRITKVAGTLTKKGGHAAERPQRHARLENPEVEPHLVPVELLEQVAADVPETRSAAGLGSEPRPNQALPVIQPIVEGCAFMEHCHRDAASLAEPDWFASLSILGRCLEGEHLAHEWSEPYPHYTHAAAERKLQHALEDAGPRTCRSIQEDLGFEGCASCQYRGRISSPIRLGTPFDTSYFVMDGGIYLDKGEDDPPQRLTNFTARISRDLMMDDDVEIVHHFEITAEVNGHTRVIVIPASKYAKMEWVCEQLGAKAVISAGYGLKDKVREAVQTLGEEMCTDETVYVHTGWRKINQNWAYLHGGGAIDAGGNISDVTTKLHGTLSRYVLELPENQPAEREAVRASLRMLDLGPDRITFPLFCSTYRAPLGNAGVSVHLVGGTGVFKTQLAALCQQHYGPGMNGTHLPGSWSSTANAMEGQIFLAKDSLFVVDDFKPTGSKYDVDRMHKGADRLIRGCANGQSRLRMNRDATLKQDKPPRTMLLSTGEDTPRGVSLRARMLIIQIDKDAISSKQLSRCQRDAKHGLYAQSMAGYLRWVAGQYEAIQKWLAERQLELRLELQADQHRRTPDSMAILIAGFELFLRYAVEIGAVDQAEADQLLERCRQALIDLANEQGQQLEEFDPAARFCELLCSAISSGHAHLAGTNQGRPVGELVLGWERGPGGGFNSRGDCIGWLVEGNFYLNLNAAMKVVSQVAVDQEGLNLNQKTMSDRLYEAGLLATSDIEAKGRKTYKVRRRINGKTENVLHLKTDVLGLDDQLIEESRRQERGVTGQFWTQENEH